MLRFSASNRASKYHVVTAACILGLVLAAFQLSPYSAVHTSAQTAGRFFPETGYNVNGPFLSFFDRFGGLRVFGYPVSGVVQEGGRQVQYFERQRFEYHSENAGTDYEIELSRLGVDWAPAAALVTKAGTAGSQPGALLIPETSHTLAAPFLGYWKANGSIRIFGYPISEVVTENGLPVQYFERARMEYHANKVAAGFGVELGLLGLQALQRTTGRSTASPVSRGAVTQAPSAQNLGAGTPQLNARESVLFSLINKARQDAGIQPVALDTVIRQLALSRSQDMVARNYFSHTTPDGSDFMSMLKGAGVSFRYAGEIIANNNYADGETAQQAFTGFMNSPHHHDILMDPRFGVAGVGEAANSKGFHYFTVIFVQK